MRMKIKRSLGISDFVTSDAMFKQVKTEYELAEERRKEQERQEREMREELEMQEIALRSKVLKEMEEVENMSGIYDARGLGTIEAIRGNVIMYRVPEELFNTSTAHFVPEGIDNVINAGHGWMRSIERDVCTRCTLVYDSYHGAGGARVLMDADISPEFSDTYEYTVDYRLLPDPRFRMVNIRPAIHQISRTLVTVNDFSIAASMQEMMK